jgi:hypothetical protein
MVLAALQHPPVRSSCLTPVRYARGRTMAANVDTRNDEKMAAVCDSAGIAGAGSRRVIPNSIATQRLEQTRLGSR